MPPAIDYRPNERAVRQAADDELRSRREAHALAWRYYRGDHRRNRLTRPGEPDDHIVINLVRQAVDRTVAFLAPGFPGLELDPAAETDAERWLREAWAHAGGARLLTKMARQGCLDGHVFVRILPGETYPRLVLLDAANVIAFWQGDDRERALWYEVHWSVGDVAFRQDIVRDADDPAGGWLVRDWRREGGGSRAAREGSAGWRLRGLEVWPFAHGPLVDWPHDTATDGYYGVGEAVNLALNDRVNKVAGDIGRILRFHASPRTVGIGFEAGDVTATAIETFWTINNPEAKVYNLEMGSDLASSMNFLDFCARSFLAERRVVMLRGELTDLRHVTNLGIRALYLDQIGRTLELRRNYEAGIIGLCRRMLALGGFADAAEGHITLNWPDALPVDTGEAVAVLERERALGILSKETAARARGYDWAVEKERMEGEDDPHSPGPSLPQGERGVGMRPASSATHTS